MLAAFSAESLRGARLCARVGLTSKNLGFLFADSQVLFAFVFSFIQQLVNLVFEWDQKLHK